MKSILKKVAGLALAAVLALGMIGCSNGNDDPVKETVATPVFSVASGAVDSGTEVTISCATEDAKIYYTTDGSNPTASSTEYKAAISVTPPMTLKAIAVKDGMNDSAVASVSYTIKETVSTPEFSVESGAVDSGTKVTISCATEGAKIYYTTDGSDPTAESTAYTEAISVTPPMTLKAIAVKDEMNDSAVASASYTIKETVATPTFSVASGAVNSGTEVTITCSTEGAKIYYTTDGTEPTASSTAYTEAISVTPPMTLKAIAVKSGMNDSAVASVSYTIKETVSTPEFSVESGAVDSGTKVTISCATEGAKIYYTTDDSDPTASSSEYTAAISITEAVTLKAIAVKDDMNDSAVASASYLIIPTRNTCVPGDFVLKDGTMLPKDITLTDTQKLNVAAVIVRAAEDGKPALGVGIVQYYLVWCKKSAIGYNKNITALQGNKTSGYMDGSDGLDKLKTACSDFSSDYRNYPAMDYGNCYGSKNDLEGDLLIGWYLPTVAELYTIYQNKKAVDASLKKAGGKPFDKDGYWSCCQVSSNSSEAGALFFSGNCYSYEKSRSLYVCSVRAF